MPDELTVVVALSGFVVDEVLPEVLVVIPSVVSPGDVTVAVYCDELPETCLVCGLYPNVAFCVGALETAPVITFTVFETLDVVGASVFVKVVARMRPPGVSVDVSSPLPEAVVVVVVLVDSVFVFDCENG